MPLRVKFEQSVRERVELVAIEVSQRAFADVRGAVQNRIADELTRRAHRVVASPYRARDAHGSKIS